MLSKKVLIGIAVVVFSLLCVALYLEHNRPIHHLTLSGDKIISMEPGQPPMVLASSIAIPDGIDNGQYILSEGSAGTIWLNQIDEDRTRAVAYFAAPGSENFKKADRIDLEQSAFNNILDFMVMHRDGQTVIEMGH